MLLLKLCFRTNIQISPSAKGESPLAVVKQCVWVKSPYQTKIELIPFPHGRQSQNFVQYTTQIISQFPTNSNLTNIMQTNTTISNLTNPKRDLLLRHFDSATGPTVSKHRPYVTIENQIKI